MGVRAQVRWSPGLVDEPCADDPRAALRVQHRTGLRDPITAHLRIGIEEQDRVGGAEGGTLIAGPGKAEIVGVPQHSHGKAAPFEVR